MRLIIYGIIIALAPLVLVTSIVCDRYSFGLVTRGTRLVGIFVKDRDNHAVQYRLTLSTNGTIKYQQQTPLPVFLRVGPKSEDLTPSLPTNTAPSSTSS